MRSDASGDKHKHIHKDKDVVQFPGEGEIIYAHIYMVMLTGGRFGNRR